MVFTNTRFAQCLRRPCAAWLCLTAVVLLPAGCIQIGDMNGDANTPKSIRVDFNTFDVGSDDCEDTFSFGDFTVQMTVTVQPGNTEVLTESRFAELGSASFQATVQSTDLDRSATFTLQPGESFEVEIRVTEDDTINSLEPQPWQDSESFDHLTVNSNSFSFTNGPGCFSDDRVDITVTATSSN